MSRLIDAEFFKTGIVSMAIVNDYSVEKVNAICKIIDAQPTAYDVDKVITEINKARDSDGMVAYVDDKPMIEKEKAIEIVKAGGTDERIH